MAVNRTVLPRKGLIQPQHGLTGYEADQDSNWAALDANVAYSGDLLAFRLGINGLISGFTLSTSATLTPGITAGALFAQGKVYAPTSAPTIRAAPANQTSYLFYNSTTGLYYQSSAVGATSGDALIGQVVTSSSAVTAVTQATAIKGWISLAPSAPGNFTVQHFLGRTPLDVIILMTSGGAIWFQSPTLYDGTNLYLVASDAGITAKVVLW